MLRRACAYPMCPNEAAPGSSYCEQHAWRRKERGRKSAARRGYDRRWQRLRRYVLASEPLCRMCGAPATEVDHIVPKRLGGTDHPDNLQALCKRCHARKTLQEMHSHVA